MFNVGDLVIYSTHGVCKIDDICEKTITGTTRMYYVLHPVDNSHKLTISTPVDNNKAVMLDLMDPKEAMEIIESFKDPGISWNNDAKQRYKSYSDIIKTGNRKEIAKIANTLLRKKQQLETQGKKFYAQDHKLLTQIQDNLFEELSFSLKTTSEEIHDRVNRFLDAS